MRPALALAALLLAVPLSAQTIRVTTPPGPAGSADVVVTNPDGQADTIAAAFVYVAPKPAIALVTPGSGPVAGGTNLTIEGTFFAPGAVVTVGGIVAPPTDEPEPEPEPLEITTSALPDGVVGVYYEHQLTATGAGGPGTYVWTLANGTRLPDGLTLSATGLISGTPTTAEFASGVTIRQGG